MSYYEEEYELARFESFHCRMLGEVAERRRAVIAAWHWRRVIRQSVVAAGY
jgi:hypothetical protein